MPHEYKYPRPSVTVDCVLFGWDGADLSVLLIRRKHDPFAGQWAFPGGFIDENEPPATAAARELEEETGLTAVDLHPFGFFGDPGRDPRGWTISLAFLAIVSRADHQATAADDAAEADWLPVTRPLQFAFDHDKILRAAVDRLRELAQLNKLPSTGIDGGELPKINDKILRL